MKMDIVFKFTYRAYQLLSASASNTGTLRGFLR